MSPCSLQLSLSKDPWQAVQTTPHTHSQHWSQCASPSSCRRGGKQQSLPHATQSLFAGLFHVVLQERFAAKPDEERLIELETLRQYLEEGKEAVDKAVASNISAVDRMKKLLTAPDKKEMIRQMAEVGVGAAPTSRGDGGSSGGGGSSSGGGRE